MRWKPEEFTRELAIATVAYDKDAAGTLCDRLIRHLHGRVEPYPDVQAKQTLQLLRNARFFELMSRVADAFLRTGMTTHQLRRQYAQSLLDRGDVTGALPILREIVSDETVPPTEYVEARGLIGRAYKQIYIDAGDTRPPHNRKVLLSAVDAYYAVYCTDKHQHLWPGINAVSLLARARRDGVDTGDRPDYIELAEAIRDAVTDRETAKVATMWDLATLAEAHVALGDWASAAQVLKQYVENPQADAFELTSTLRQFESVWQLDRDERDESLLLDLLRSELLKRDGGMMSQSPDRLKSGIEDAAARVQGLEALLGDQKYQSHTWFLTCLKRAQGVARIWLGVKRGVGTGFLVPGSLLSDAWKDHQVLMTNNHVITTRPSGMSGIKPEEAEITFDALHGGGTDQPRYRVAEVLKESSIYDLDYTCLRLDKEVEGVDSYRAAGSLPARDSKDRVYVIGHPRGGELSYSIQDNRLLDLNDTRIHYRSPTEPGSSGSPLFNDNWELIGIHHAGSLQARRLDDPTEVYRANEGIPLPAILKETASPASAGSHA